MDRNFAWYAIVGVLFYLFITLVTSYHYLGGELGSAMQTLKVAILITGLNIAVFGGYYLFWSLPTRYRERLTAIGV